MFRIHETSVTSVTEGTLFINYNELRALPNSKTIGNRNRTSGSFFHKPCNLLFSCVSFLFTSLVGKDTISISTEKGTDMKTLTLNTGSFDQVNSFGIEVKNYKGDMKIRKVSLYQDYEKSGDGIYWALMSGAMVKSSYTDEDRAETDRIYRNEAPVRDGDVVLIDGDQYKTEVNGEYSNCAVFHPV